MLSLELDVLDNAEGKAPEECYLLHTVNTVSQGMGAALTKVFLARGVFCDSYGKKQHSVLIKVHFLASKERYKQRLSEFSPKALEIIQRTEK